MGVTRQQFRGGAEHYAYDGSLRGGTEHGKVYLLHQPRPLFVNTNLHTCHTYCTYHNYHPHYHVYTGLLSPHPLSFPLQASSYLARPRHDLRSTDMAAALNPAMRHSLVS